MTQDNPIALAILGDKDFQSLKSYIIATTGLSYFLQKDDDLAGRIARRFQLIGSRDCAEYKIMLGVSTAPGSEFDSLVAELTIGETFFFRHSEQFDALRQVVLPKVIEANQQKRSLRIWCAGCSSGAEPYTLSIILRQEYRAALAGWNIEIVGTDINRNFLARATLGHFDDWHLRSMAEPMKTVCFKRSADKSWLIQDEYKKGMSFIHHNLISGRYPPQHDSNENFDIIFCRNVMIYFSAETVASILPRFDRSLHPHGYLFLGYSEINTDLYKAFDPVSFPGALLFKKKAESASLFAPQPVLSPLSFLPAEPRPQLPAFKEPIGIATPAKPKTLDALIEARQIANKGDFALALKKVDEILLLNSLDASAFYIRGLCLLEMNNLPGAEEAFKKCVYIDRKFCLSHYHLALIYQKLGDEQKSLRFLNNAADLIRELPEQNLILAGDDMTVHQLSHMIKTMMRTAS
ncbi:MAG: CheR family methyltransferase [Bdellovibrionota bacterium]|nr:MAG: hypothetical protein EOP10_07715 [Pseudomonadota bacterium]